MVKTYSKSTQGNIKLSAHFAIWEFASKDGTDEVLISADLINKLEQIYESLNCSKIIVNSGYRTPSHDRAVGGNGKGQHTLGKAADIQCYDKDGSIIEAKYVCCAAETLSCNGIGYISSKAMHIDTRSGKWWGDETTGNDSIGSFYSYFGITKPSLTNTNNTSDTYTVVKGDTLSAIASKYNTAVLSLATYNNISNPNLISIGQVIKIPNNQPSVNNVPPKPSNPYAEPTRNIKKNNSGNDVKWVQWELRNKGYGIGSAGIDGICGNNTFNAVQRFQKNEGLEVDGIVGIKTRTKFKSL